MITISNPERYIAGLYPRLSNENIEVSNGAVVETAEDERESGSISNQKLFLKNSQEFANSHFSLLLAIKSSFPRSKATIFLSA